MRAQRRLQQFPCRILASAALVAVLSDATAGAVHAQTIAGAPVSVLQCDVRDGGGPLFGAGKVAGAGEQELDVTYRNDGRADLRLLTFMVTVGGVPVVTVFAKTGTLAGATGSSKAVIAQSVVPLSGSIGCLVAGVDFADGITWRDPAIVPTSGGTPVQTPGAPLTVQQCDMADPQASIPVYTLYETLLLRAPVAATRVDMSLFAGRDRLMTFSREGPIAPGAPTHAKHAISRHLFPLRDLHLQCRIDRIAFADGTAWQNPAWPDFPWDTPQTPGAQVDVLRCSSSSNTPRDYAYSRLRQTMFVDFRNTASVAANEIDFAFGAFGKIVGSARARGSYAPNAVVSNLHLPDPALPYFLGTELPVCFVTHVEYADGTSWSAPQR